MVVHVRSLRACAVFVGGPGDDIPGCPRRTGVPLSGRLLNSLNATPLGGATVDRRAAARDDVGRRRHVYV